MNQMHNIDDKLYKPTIHTRDIIIMISTVFLCIFLAFITGARYGQKKGANTVQQQWDQAELDRKACPCDTLNYTVQEYWDNKSEEE